MLFQPSWQHDNQFSSETNTARISFQECSDHVSVSLASYLRMANSACTHEVTHQNGFTLYVFSQTIVMLHKLCFSSMSVTMHRPCMTSYKSVNPTTKHLSLVRHGHLRCLPSLPETSTEGTEIYAMSAIEMHSDMISTCSNLDTQN